MTHISLSSPDSTNLRNGAEYNDAMTRMAGELIEKFRVAPSGLTNGSWSLLTEILDFAVEAEQTIAEQKQRIQELESLAITDPLTGLLNRRGLEMELDHAIARNQRHDEPGLFVYVDLDEFKDVNDCYGHAAGDALIRHVARILKGSIRQTDYAGRLGGDEFGLLLSHCDSRQFSAAHLMYIRRRLEKNPLQFEGRILRAGASFGIARISGNSSRETIMNHADEQMYYDKKARRRARCEMKQIMTVGGMAE